MENKIKKSNKAKPKKEQIDRIDRIDRNDRNDRIDRIDNIDRIDRRVALFRQPIIQDESHDWPEPNEEQNVEERKNLEEDDQINFRRVPNQESPNRLRQKEVIFKSLIYTFRRKKLTKRGK